MDIFITVCGWLGAGFSVLGAFLVASDKWRLKGFIIFLGADALLSGVQIRDHAWNQVTLLATFAVMNVIGIRNALKVKG